MSPQIGQFETYQQKPFDEAGLNPLDTGLYVYFGTDKTFFTFINGDGSCYLFSRDTMLTKREALDFATYRAARTKEYPFYSLDAWGHYVVNDNKVKIQYLERVHSAYENQLVTLSGEVKSDNVFFVHQGITEWTARTSKDQVSQMFLPPREYVFLTDSIYFSNKEFTGQTWYKENVWHAND